MNRRARRPVTAHLRKFSERPIVVVEPHSDGWLVISPRGHCWVHADLGNAFADARTVAEGFGAWVLTTNQHQQEE